MHAPAATEAGKISTYLMMNKPRGYITAMKDPLRKTVAELLPPGIRCSVHPVGRLDMDTEGFLLFTDDGMADVSLLSPDRHVSKTYWFCALGRYDRSFPEKAANGMPIEGGRYVTKSAVFEYGGSMTKKEAAQLLSQYDRKRLLKIRDASLYCGSLTLTEGRKHQVKQMVAAAGAKVIYLKRTAFAGISLDPTLGPGEYRPLNETETALILKNI